MSEQKESIPLKYQIEKAKKILEKDEKGRFKHSSDNEVNDALVEEINKKYKYRKRRE